MFDITIHRYEVVFYTEHGAHRYTVTAPDKDLAIEQALAIHNDERETQLLYHQLNSRNTEVKRR